MRVFTFVVSASLFSHVEVRLFGDREVVLGRNLNGNCDIFSGRIIVKLGWGEAEELTANVIFQKKIISGSTLMCLAFGSP